MVRLTILTWGNVAVMESKLFFIATDDFVALNPDLQREIYMEYYKLVYSPIIYMVKDHATAEDIIQISFLKVIKKRPAAENEAKLKAWIHVVVKNTVYDFFKKSKKNRNEMDSDHVYINESPVYATEAGDIESQIELKLMIEALEKYLEDIKPEYKSLIELRWKRDLSYKEIALRLDTTEETVKYKLFRVREAMRKRFLKEWEAEK
ncbi:RNA polymerase sigma factor [Paenibacillus humicus]|nr:RNA polymerase sigma factor [Paenibacillus humicus]